MNKTHILRLFASSILLLATLSSCATIIGGSSYYAKVTVPKDLEVQIEHEGNVKGIGEASFLTKRKEANNFTVVIKKEGCEDQIETFTKRSFRYWALVGSVFGWTGIIPAPVPVGVIFDAVTGAYWKPDVNEKNVSKENYNHYIYQIDYAGCKVKTETEIKTTNKTPAVNTESKVYRLRAFKKLLDDKIITKDEFRKEKKKILAE